VVWPTPDNCRSGIGIGYLKEFGLQSWVECSRRECNAGHHMDKCMHILDMISGQYRWAWTRTSKKHVVPSRRLADPPLAFRCTGQWPLGAEDAIELGGTFVVAGRSRQRWCYIWRSQPRSDMPLRCSLCRFRWQNHFQTEQQKITSTTLIHWIHQFGSSLIYKRIIKHIDYNFTTTLQNRARRRWGCIKLLQCWCKQTSSHEGALEDTEV